MSHGDMITLAVMGIYIVVILIIGFYFARRSNESSENYFLGGRKIGVWATALSAEASDMSGWLLMGLPGVAYFCGASDAMWTAIGLAIGTYLNWLFVAKRLRKYSQKANNAITIPSFFANRFGDTKGIIKTIAALVILLFFCVYVGSCFATCGKLFASLFDLNYGTMMVIGALLVFIYTFAGGYLSVCTTDLIQGLLMIVAILVIFIGSITAAGGVENTVAFLKDIPGFLSATSMATPVLGADGVTQVVQNGAPLFGEPASYGFITIISTMSWGLGYFGVPQVLVRFMGIEKPESIKRSRRIAVVWVIISLAAAVLIGLIGRAIIPTTLLTASSAETIFVVLSKMILPAVVTGVVVSGIFAATMSSSDSYMLIVGSSIANDLFKGVIKKDASDRTVMFVSRCALVAVLLFGMFIARDQNSNIFNIVSYAWAGFGAAFGPVMLLSLFWKRANMAGAIGGMVTGGATVVIWNALQSAYGGIFNIYELLPAFLLALIVNVVVSLITKPPSDDVVELFEHYMDDDYIVDNETYPYVPAEPAEAEAAIEAEAPAEAEAIATGALEESQA
ncbi:MAG: sodium/proline symporter PutP [bacterium]|nr:sodium/proline symporter PutP [bacterium]